MFKNLPLAKTQHLRADQACVPGPAKDCQHESQCHEVHHFPHQHGHHDDDEEQRYHQQAIADEHQNPIGAPSLVTSNHPDHNRDDARYCSRDHRDGQRVAHCEGRLPEDVLPVGIGPQPVSARWR